jgi:phospholipase/carboxylesterase
VFAVGLSLPGAARADRPQPLPYVEIVTGGAAADAQLPLIIALHGRGDTAEAFAGLFDELTVPARVAILRPPRAWGGGQAWFLSARAHEENRPVIAAELLGLADRVVATAEAIRASRPARGRAVVMGFSQGGMLAWAIAVKHPRAFAAVFPLAGFLFPEILARVRLDAAATPTIVAFHGDADPLVPIEEDRQGVRALEKRGVHPELRVFRGVGHELPPPSVANSSPRWRRRSRADGRRGGQIQKRITATVAPKPTVWLRPQPAIGRSVNAVVCKRHVCQKGSASAAPVVTSETALLAIVPFASLLSP